MTDGLWVYDLRTNQHFTLKQSPIQRKDFDEFVAAYRPGRLHERTETWNAGNPDGRWRSYSYEDLLKRDKLNLDLFWIKGKSLRTPIRFRRRMSWPRKSPMIWRPRWSSSPRSPCGWLAGNSHEGRRSPPHRHPAEWKLTNMQR